MYVLYLLLIFSTIANIHISDVSCRRRWDKMKDLFSLDKINKKMQDILKDKEDYIGKDGRVTVNNKSVLNKDTIKKSPTNKFTISKSVTSKEEGKKEEKKDIQERYSMHEEEVIKNRFRELTKPKFHPAWMDYCDPYHCNDYHKRACGLNRANMKFQWFQSACHIIMNNMCHTYRGFLKYDIIQPKFCEKFVPKLKLRMGCPDACDDLLLPICTRSKIDHQYVIFKNQCYMDKVNCRVESFLEYMEVDFSLCTDYVRIG